MYSFHPNIISEEAKAHHEELVCSAAKMRLVRKIRGGSARRTRTRYHKLMAVFGQRFTMLGQYLERRYGQATYHPAANHVNGSSSSQ